MIPLGSFFFRSLCSSREGRRFDPDTPGGCQGLVGGRHNRAFVMLHTRPTHPLRSVIGERKVSEKWNASIRSVTVTVL